MAGIYIHIPFCKVKCHYCDFHFSTRLMGINPMVSAINSEIELRKNYLGGESISTIYFGGGTPSLIGAENINKILAKISSTFPVEDNVELTLECNPDDLDEPSLINLKEIGINRLSIGIQSFDDEVLKKLNRAHNQIQAIKCLDLAKKTGFENITIDLIYGIPATNSKYWETQLEYFFKFNIDHLSAYCLTIESNTVFGNWLKKGKLIPVSDKIALDQFKYLMDRMRIENYEQYEISNFCRVGAISKHNSAYWLGEKYIGIGPSAHSYNLKERQWNIAHNIKYIKALSNGEPFYKNEILTSNEKYNDYILTRLRTKWGVNQNELDQIIKTNSKSVVEQHIVDGNLIEKGQVYYLTEKGKYIADSISADLFI